MQSGESDIEISESAYNDLIEELRIHRRGKRQQHIENIQIAVASLIIGSYFTEVAQSFNQIGNSWYTNFILIVSTGFVLSKLTSLSAREMGLDRIERVSGSIVAPLVFTISVIGYAALLMVEFLPIDPAYVSNVGIIAFSVVLGLVSIGVTIRTYWQAVAGYADAASELQIGAVKSARLEYLVSNFPDVVEQGLEVIDRNVDLEQGKQIDFVCEDSDGNSAIVELKLMNEHNSSIITRKAVQSLDFISEDFDRIILATNISPNASDLEYLRENGIDLRLVDEYQIFGPFSEVIRFFDQHVAVFPVVSSIAK